MLEGMGLVLVEWRQMDLEQGVKSGLCAQQNQELLGHCHYHYPILSEIMRLKKKGASNFCHWPAVNMGMVAPGWVDTTICIPQDNREMVYVTEWQELDQTLGGGYTAPPTPTAWTKSCCMLAGGSTCAERISQGGVKPHFQGCWLNIHLCPRAIFSELIKHCALTLLSRMSMPSMWARLALDLILKIIETEQKRRWVALTPYIKKIPLKHCVRAPSLLSTHLFIKHNKDLYLM